MEKENKELEKDLDKHKKKKEEGSYDSLIKQIDTEYSIGIQYMKPKFAEWVVRLKLYNNQKRDKKAIGDPLLFTVHQTILASLYDDYLNFDFLARERGDEEIAENLNILGKFDFDEMEKDKIDYEWDWDATFFGRALLMFMEFDRDSKTPIPQVMDPLATLRDPRATSVNGDRKGRGAASFYGREIRLTMHELEAAGVYDLSNLKADSTKRTDIDDNRQQREQAQGYNQVKSRLTGDNEEFICTEWFTFWKGKRVFVTLANDRKKVIRMRPIQSNYWPTIDRSIYPVAHDWDGVSIPDLIEDKQRARAKLENLALKSVDHSVNSRYLYDKTKIKNKADLLNVKMNKYVAVDGPTSGAVEPIQTVSIKNDVNWILGILDAGAQRATATPELQQGVLSADKRTATELGQVQKNVDTRYSLSAKVFGWSEKRFWKQWYSIYKTHFKDGIDEKIVRLHGAYGAEWRPFTKENIIGKTDPDVMIESKAISEAKKVQKLQMFSGWAAQALSTDPSINKREVVKFQGKLSGLTKDELARLMPLTFDEYEAEKENQLLNNGKIPKISMTQDHQTHKLIHSLAKESKERDRHIEMHDVAMFVKRERPDMFPEGEVPQADQATPAQQGGPTVKDLSAPQIQPANQLQTA